MTRVTMYHCIIQNNKVVLSALVFAESVSFSARTKPLVLSRSVSYRNQSHPRSRFRTAVQHQLVNHIVFLTVGEPSYYLSFVSFKPVHLPSTTHSCLCSFFLIVLFDCVRGTYKSCSRLVSCTSYTRCAIRVVLYLAVHFMQIFLELVRHRS